MTGKIKRVLITVVGLVGFTIIAALQMSLNVGLNPWDGLGFTLSRITDIKVGTIGLIKTSCLILIQIMLLKGKLSLKLLWQVMAGFFMGRFINVFYYDVFTTELLGSYEIRIVVYIFSIIIAAFFIALIQWAKVINLPLEGTLQVLSSKIDVDFAKIRFAVDIMSIILIVVLLLLFKVPSPIREGTIIFVGRTNLTSLSSLQNTSSNKSGKLKACNFIVFLFIYPPII